MASNKQNTSTIWALITLITCLGIRLLIVLLYKPVAFGDTPSYRRLAEAVLKGFETYDGTRTPGYPVFLALVGSDQNVWLVQLLLGLATTFLLFFIGWKLTDRAWFGGLIGLLHTFNLGQLFFESNLLTETLTTFMLVLTMAGMCIWVLYPKKHSPWLAMLIGLTSSMTLLVRPLFVFLPFYLLLFLLISFKSNSQPASLDHNKDFNPEVNPVIAKRIPGWYFLAFILPVIIILGGWINFIHARYGDWSLTTMTGYHLIQHTGSFFEFVPDEYASLRDTYIRYRNIQIAQFGTQTNTIWEAIPEMEKVSGYNFYDLSSVLTRISIRLILEHPFLFLKNAVNGWWLFWRTSVYWSTEALRFSWMAGWVNISIQIQRVILFSINLIFIAASLILGIYTIVAAAQQKSRRSFLRFTRQAQVTYFWLLSSIIWIASILQTLLDHGDNPRFLVPLQSLVVLWVALFFFQLATNKQAQVRTTTQAG